MKSGGAIRRELPAIVVLAMVTVTLSLAAAASAAPTGEFLNPSWTELPAPSVYNTTPSCPVSRTERYCEVPESDWPPPDPGSLEWGERTKNPDGSWDTFRTGYINSAYWPAEKRPDIETYGIERFGYEFEKPEGCSSKLPHYCFLTAAQKLGYPIDHHPEVGALWLATGECMEAASEFPEYLPEGPASGTACTRDNQWYIGYVEQVLPGGAFVISWGGSTTAADTGLELVYMFPTLAPVSEFIHLMPPGTPRPSGSPEEDESPARRSLSPNLRLSARAVRGRLFIGVHLAPKARGKIAVRLHEGKKTRLLRLHGRGVARKASLSPGPGRYLIVAKFHPSPKSGWRSQKVRRIIWIHH
jgi:hypothetical protein